MTDPKSVFVITGAFDCGKTTTLQWLRDRCGLRIHDEAHLRALAALGEPTAGHPPDGAFEAIDDPSHACPMCRPLAFAEQVLEHQRQIERSARTGDLLERGYLDPIEMLLRNAGEDAAWQLPDWVPIARYVRVLAFEVMPKLQRPRWGKTIDARIAEARAIGARLERLYCDAGLEVVRIGPGTVEQRARRVLEVIR